MKKQIFIFSVAVICAAASLATVGCAGCGGARNASSAGEPLVLNLYDTTGGVYWTDTITGDPSQCEGGGFWDNTYNGNVHSLQFGRFVFSHESGFDEYSYWGGFTVGTSGDKYCYSDSCAIRCDNSCLNPAVNCSYSGSDEWIHNQWGVMAGGGIVDATADPPSVDKGVPYLIGYWDSFSESGGQRSLEVRLDDHSFFEPQEVFICNHPWPYYGNMYGDGFAHSFKEGDYFELRIHAVKANGREDSISHTLARYRSGELVQNPDWEWVDLTKLFEEDRDSIQFLYFTMFSTDTYPGHPEWPNTAVYFCMDKLKVAPADAAAPAAKARRAVAPKPAIEFTDHLPFHSYAGGKATVYDAKGKEALQTTLKAGDNRVNLSTLPAGDYRLRHGHRAIPIRKTK